MTIHGTAEQQRQFVAGLSCGPDELMERCQLALLMTPDNLHVDVWLYGSAGGVQDLYRRLYGGELQSMMFCQLTDAAVHTALPKWHHGMKEYTRMIAHEFGHIIMEAYLGFPHRNSEEWSYPGHEAVAQYCAREVRL